MQRLLLDKYRFMFDKWYWCTFDDPNEARFTEWPSAAAAQPEQHSPGGIRLDLSTQLSEGEQAVEASPQLVPGVPVPAPVPPFDLSRTDHHPPEVPEPRLALHGKRGSLAAAGTSVAQAASQSPLITIHGRITPRFYSLLQATVAQAAATRRQSVAAQRRRSVAAVVQAGGFSLGSDGQLVVDQQDVVEAAKAEGRRRQAQARSASLSRPYMVIIDLTSCRPSPPPRFYPS